MKNWFTTHLGKSWKTTLIGYLMAVLIAVQPLMNDEIDFTNKQQVTKYAFKLLIAALIAIMGKYAADSAQVKAVDQKVEERT